MSRPVGGGPLRPVRSLTDQDGDSLTVGIDYGLVTIRRGDPHRLPASGGTLVARLAPDQTVALVLALLVSMDESADDWREHQL